MSELVLVIGQASSGKTTSLVEVESLGIEGLPAESTAFISCIGKGLPVKNWKDKYKLYKSTDDSIQIHNALNNLRDRPDVKQIVIDDYQFIFSNKFAADVSAGKTAGNAVFERYNEIFTKHVGLFNAFSHMREDQIVFVLAHSERVEVNGTVQEKMKTIGKAIDKHQSAEGQTEIILHSVSEMDLDKPTKFFLTQTDGLKMARSPIDMFPEMKIPNDMGKVMKYIREFRGI